MRIAGRENAVRSRRSSDTSWIARSSFGTASSNRRLKKCAAPTKQSGVPMRARGLSRSAVFDMLDREIGLAATILSAPLMTSRARSSG